MEAMTVGEAANLCGGELLAGDPSIRARGITIDSRTIEKGQLFLALPGDRFDGHDFAGSACEKGAAAIIGQQPKVGKIADQAASVIAVEDSLGALQLIAEKYRLRFDIPLIAITGSCGKTTTKDMLGDILAQTLKTLKTKGNFNNLIGAPLMLLDLEADIEAAVFEIASNAPGEIGKLSEILSPTAGIITNIAPVHLEGFGNLEGVLREKCSLAGYIRPGGFIVVNGGDIPIGYIRSIFSGKIITFGLENSFDYFCADIQCDMSIGTRFLLNGEDEIQIPILGKHNALNAVAAIAASLELGVSMDSIRAGLKSFSPTPMRMQLIEHKGANIINDAYNANPRAMREAITTMTKLPAERRILALGDMLELGDNAQIEHHALGQFIGETAIDLLYVCGEFREDMAKGAIDAGMQPERVFECADPDEIATSLKYILRSGDILLVKGSRGIKMEQVIQRLVEEG